MRASLNRCCSRAIAASFKPTAIPVMGDDWGFSMEELDRLENSAAQQVAARRNNAATFGGSLFATRPDLLARSMDGRAPTQPISSPKKKIFLKVSKQANDKVGFKSAYDQGLIAAYKAVPGHEWMPDLKIWAFPEYRLPEVIAAVTNIPGAEVDIQPVAPYKFPSEVYRLLNSNPVPNLTPPFPSPIKSQESSASARGTPRKSITVQILPDNDRIVARSPYDVNVKEACQSVPGRIWQSDERAWTFPKSSIDDLVKALEEFAHIKVEVDPYLKASSQFSSPDSSLTPPTIRDESSKLQVKMFLHHSGSVAIQSPAFTRLTDAIKTIPRSYWSYGLWLFPPSYVAEAEKILGSVNNVQLEPFVPLVRRALKHLAEVQNLSVEYGRIPDYLESSLLPFQRDGVRFVLQHGGRALIADEMGLGKTVQAIAVAACFPEDWPVLIIVPSSLRIQWAAMLKAWLRLPPGDITVVLSQGGSSTREGFTIVRSAGKSLIELNGVFNIISYDLVAKLRDAAKFKIVIADESHYLKNPQAKRSIACLPVLKSAKYAILLTGTPALSRPIELFKQLEALQPIVYSEMHEYGQRYCTGSMFGLYQGSSNREELHALLKTTVMIRRLKREVLSELPEKVRQQVFLSLDMKNTKELRALFAQLKKLRGSMEALADEGMDKMKAEEKQLITKIYSESAVAKLPAVEEYLSTVLEADCKLLVFAHHHTMLDGIESHLKKRKTDYIRIDGQTPATTRQGLVTKFQENEAVKVAVLSIRAAGVGLTLTAASNVIFAEMSWTPGDLVQAEDRAHRLGQHSSVNIYYLHAQETIDDLIWESVKLKLGNLGQVLNGRQEQLHLTPSPSSRQAKINSYLRPCDRGLSEEEARSSKRCKLNFD